MERQAFAGWIYALLAASGAAGALSYRAAAQPGQGAALLAALGLSANLLSLQTRVTRREIVVTFGALFPLYRRRIALADVVAAEAVTYSPLREYGGWGIRGIGRDRTLNARGNRGVRLMLRNEERLLIGSQRPAELAAAIQEGMTP